MNFDERAKNWDTDNRIKRAKIIGDEIYSHVKNLNYREFEALEFGCGTGLISFFLNDKFKSIDLFDSSRGMIEVLKSKIKEENINNMSVLDEIGEIPKYDIIYSSMALHHIVDAQKTLVKLAKLLNKGGHLCIVDLGEDDGSFHKAEKDFIGHNGFNLYSFADWMKKALLNDVYCKTFYNGKKETSGGEIKYSLFIAVGEKR